MTELRGILLDLDGTVADSIDFFYRLTCEVLAEIHASIPARAEVLRAIAMGIPPTALFVPSDYPDREAFLERLYVARWPEWLERYGREVEPVPGACETVEDLHRRGLRLALVTSSSGELPFLERWGIRGFFSAIVNREAVRKIKPDPEPLLSGLSRLGMDAASVWSIGDSPIDARAGKAAGLRTIGVLTGAGTEEQLRSEGVEIVLGSLSELTALLDEESIR